MMYDAMCYVNPADTIAVKRHRSTLVRMFRFYARWRVIILYALEQSDPLLTTVETLLVHSRERASVSNETGYRTHFAYSQ